MTLKHLRTLHCIIGDAITELESKFQHAGLDYPSLHSPYEHSASQLLSEDADVLNLTNRIVAASDHLISSVRSPYSTVVHSGMAVGYPYTDYSDFPSTENSSYVVFAPSVPSRSRGSTYPRNCS